MKTAVLGEEPDGSVTYNPALVDLLAHYGAVPRACRPYRAQTKGKVERPFRYVRQDFFLARNFRDLDDLNRQFDRWRTTLANPRTHATTGRVVDVAFAGERPQLIPLPAVPYSAPLTVERRISRDGMVSVAGNLYSVPDATRRRVVEVQNHPGQVRIFEDGALIAAHPVLEGRKPAPARSEPPHRAARRARTARPAAGPATPAGLLRRRRPASGRLRSTAVSGLLDRIHANLVGLNMPRALETLADIVQRLERGEIGALEAIDALLAEELDIRENRRVGVALKTARLNPPKTLESFDFSFQPSLDRDRVLTLAQLDFVDRAEVVHLLGPPGTGKSHLAVALGIAAVKARKSVYRTTLAELVEALAKARREDRLAEKIRFFTRTSLLIVDEIGYVTIDGGAANLFFQLVNARYEKGAMILTSNRGFAEWGELFGDPVVATALLDRLLHHAVVIHIEGASYRLREHTDLIPEHVRANAPISPPPAPKRRGRPPRNKQQNTDARR